MIKKIICILFCIGVSMKTTTPTLAKVNIITHGEKTSLGADAHERDLGKRENHTLPLEEEKKLLRKLLTFDLGRFLLENKGLNGYWTSYIILHGPQKKDLGSLEDWVLNRAPAVKATRERFFIFQGILQKNLKSHTKITSIPCGVMDDLLHLNYEGKKEIHLVGLDLDQKSLELAKENAQKKGYENTSFRKQDAWLLDEKNSYDIITSNGLNIYESDDDKVTKLYQNFNQALKPGGILITSFLTPPPALSKESSWRNYDKGDALKQKAVFGDILQVSWQSFRTEAQTRKQLQKAGFDDIEIIYDSQGMFPTVVARKRK